MRIRSGTSVLSMINRQADDYSRPSLCAVRCSDGATVFFDDPLRDGKTEAGAAPPAREEGLEDAQELVGTEARALIAYRDNELLPFRAPGDRDALPGSGVLHRVEQQVLEDEHEPARIHQHGLIRAGEVGLDRYLVVGGAGLGRLHRLLQHGAGIARREVGGSGASEGEQVLRQALQPRDPLAQRLGQLGRLGTVADLLVEEIQRYGQPEERVLHFVRDAGHELAKGRELLAAADGLLQAEDLRRVAHDDDEAVGLPPRGGGPAGPPPARPPATTCAVHGIALSRTAVAMSHSVFHGSPPRVTSR